MFRGVRSRAHGREVGMYKRLANWPDFPGMIPKGSWAIVPQCCRIQGACSNNQKVCGFRVCRVWGFGGSGYDKRSGAVRINPSRSKS